MMNTYMLLGGILSAIALTAGGMFIFSKAHYLAKVGLATFVVALSIYAWSVSVAAFGYAVDQVPHDKAQILALSMDKRAGFIYFWIAQHDIGPRAYRIPYTDKMGKDLADAEAKAKATGGIMLFRDGKKKKEGDGQGGDGKGNGDGTEKGGKGNPGNSTGKFGGKGQSYGGAPMGGDSATVDVSIDVIPSLPEKQ